MYIYNVTMNIEESSEELVVCDEGGPYPEMHGH